MECFTVSASDGLVPSDLWMERLTEALCVGSSVSLTIAADALPAVVVGHVYAVLRAYRARAKDPRREPLKGPQGAPVPIRALVPLVLEQLALDVGIRRHLLGCASHKCPVRQVAPAALRDGCPA